MKSLAASAVSAHSYCEGPAVTPVRVPQGKGPSLTGQPQQMCGWSFLPTEQENYRPGLTGTRPCCCRRSLLAGAVGPCATAYGVCH